MNNRKSLPAVRPSHILLLVVILGALTPFPLRLASVTNAQTETVAPVPGGGGDPGGPAAPVLTTSKGPGWINVEWEPVAGADTYDIWWRTGDNGGWRRAESSPITSTAYSFIGVSDGTVLYFLVRAIDVNGKVSAWSELAHATAIGRVTSTPTLTPAASGNLSAPTLSATSSGANAVELSWTEVSVADRYELWTWWDSTTGWQRLDNGSLKDRSHTHGGLTAGTTYYYTVRAVAADGTTSDWSEYARATVGASAIQTPTATVAPNASTISTTFTPTATVSALSAPTLKAEAGAAQVTLTWERAASANRYELWTWWDSSSGWQRLDDGNLSVTSYTHSGLTAGTTYYYAIRAIDASGTTSPWSDYPSATVSTTTGTTATRTPNPTPTLTPTAGPAQTAPPVAGTGGDPGGPAAPVLTTTPGLNWIDLEWEAVAGADMYEIWSRRGANGTWRRASGTSQTTTGISFLGLTLGETYFFLARSIAADGKVSAWSNLAQDAATGSLSSTPTATFTPSSTVTSGPTPTPTPTPTATTVPPAPAAERAALVALYNATNGANWLENGNWLTNEPISTWHGVFTNDAGHVTGLSLRDNGLRGQLPDLSALTYLRSLILTDNQLTGPIPDLSALTHLTGVNLYSNDLTGEIPDLSSLVNLKHLYLFGNELTGEIPDLSALTKLTRLYLGDNRLTGPIPDLSALTNLYYLSLRRNDLSGPIPDMSSLTKLVELSLRANRLTGEIPDLNALTRLRELYLNDNRLTGEIPDLSAHTRLENISLAENELTGEIPDLDQLGNLETLDLSSNDLSGTIPDLGNLSNLEYLELSNNELRGEIPDLGALTNLTWLELNGNRLEGEIPALDALASVTRFDVSNNQLTGPVPDLSTLLSVTSLNLRGNQLCLSALADLAGSNSVVRAHLNSLNLSACPGTELTAPPDRPQNLSATVSTGQVTLLWDAVPNAASYSLRVWDSFDRRWSSIGSAPTIPTYTHTVRTDGRNYYYQVRARDASGLGGGWSEQLHVAVVSTLFPPPPASLGLEMYYQKYMVVSGVEVVAPSLVSDEQMIRSREVITGLLANRSDLLGTLAANSARIYIQDRFRGIAYGWTAYTPVTDPYCRTFIHEFAHMVHRAIEEQSDGAEFNKRLRAQWQAAINAGRWRGYYAATNFSEYWAETVKFWLWETLPPSLAANHAELADYDPEIAKLVEEVFGDTATVPASCKP